MPIRPLRAALAAAALLTAFAGAAHAGQFRINVSNFVFSPRAVNLDMGDHAVWVWTGGTHTVTSGDSTGFMSGLFNSNSVDFGGAFSFRTSTPQLIRYYCIPHAPDMAGRLIVQASGNNNASDFRLTEVLFAGGEDRVEIANLGATGDLALITGAYVRVRYGEYPESGEEVEAVIRAWRAVRQDGARMLRRHR